MEFKQKIIKAKELKTGDVILLMGSMVLYRIGRVENITKVIPAHEEERRKPTRRVVWVEEERKYVTKIYDVDVKYLFGSSGKENSHFDGGEYDPNWEFLLLEREMGGVK